LLIYDRRSIFIIKTIVDLSSQWNVHWPFSQSDETWARSLPWDVPRIS